MEKDKPKSLSSRRVQSSLDKFVKKKVDERKNNPSEEDSEGTTSGTSESEKENTTSPIGWFFHCFQNNPIPK
jgi:hypothetical protein